VEDGARGVDHEQAACHDGAMEGETTERAMGALTLVGGDCREAARPVPCSAQCVFSRHERECGARPLGKSWPVARRQDTIRIKRDQAIEIGQVSEIDEWSKVVGIRNCC